jgi:hypothetical protein
MVDLPLETMTVAEKLRVMETVWASLSQNSVTDVLPEWHAEILKERSNRLESGEATVSSWSDAKRRLQDLD